jgi:hypothetical protein
VNFLSFFVKKKKKKKKKKEQKIKKQKKNEREKKRRGNLFIYCLIVWDGWIVHRCKSNFEI